MKPTIGRIVHFRPVVMTISKDVWPAIITTVWSDTSVNLHVFEDGSFDIPSSLTPTSVKLTDEDTGEQFTCWWPPRS